MCIQKYNVNVMSPPQIFFWIRLCGERREIPVMFHPDHMWLESTVHSLLNQSLFRLTRLRVPFRHSSKYAPKFRWLFISAENHFFAHKIYAVRKANTELMFSRNYDGFIFRGKIITAIIVFNVIETVLRYITSMI